MLRRAKEDGARFVVDRSEEVVPGSERGYFVGPTVVTDVDADSEIYQEELFAPVLTVLPAATLDEALDMIDNSPFCNNL